MRILGIESSCDETACAVVENGRKVLSSVVFSQVPLHRPFRGIVPEIASRSHLEKINGVLEASLRRAGLLKKKRRPGQAPEGLDAVAVTVGPGLVGSLLVGKMTAEALGWIWNLPVIGINHLEAHLFANLLESPHLEPPFLGLVVSGGHTDLILVEDYGKYDILGRTRDDAAGECFDKVANILNLGYPGGPLVDKRARRGNPKAVSFSRPYMPDSWDFSFSGLKTAVLYHMRDRRSAPNAKEIADICASFQAAVTDVLVRKTLAAAKKFKLKRVVVGGGVSANSEIRKRFLVDGKKNHLEIHLPSRANCTDNAAMIAGLAFYKTVRPESLKVDPSLPIADWKR